MSAIRFFTPAEEAGRWYYQDCHERKHLVERIGPLDRADLWDTREDDLVEQHEGNTYTLWRYVGLPPCLECGIGVVTRDSSDGPEMQERQLCFSCLFWHHRLEEQGKPEVFIARGHRYSIGPEEPKTLLAIRGCAGARQRIRFFDGREVETTNLWHQGEIPAHFRERLPDNAEFI